MASFPELEVNPIPLTGSYKDQFASVVLFDALVAAFQHVDINSLSKSHVNPHDWDVHNLPRRAAEPEVSFDKPDPKNLKVCIIGAGIAGLYTAIILDRLGIPYDILEASDRIGGRIYTHYFSDPKEAEKTHDYYDIGAMRFPHTDMMAQTFKLFKMVDLEPGKPGMMEYFMESENQPTRYNGITTFYKKDEPEKFDPYKVSVQNHGNIPDDSVRDSTEILNDAYGWYRQKIKRNEITGFRYLLKHDKHSLRDYLTFVEDQDRNTVDWLETLNSATGWFDMAFTENVLESLAFDWEDPKSTDEKVDVKDPAAPLPTQTADLTTPTSKSTQMLEDKKVTWYCINGGTQKVVDRILEQNLISQEPQLEKRVVALSYHSEADNVKKMEVSYVDDKVKPEDGTTKERPSVTKQYAAVINTTTLGALQKMDLTGCNLSYPYKTAIRSLRYDTSTKVGIKFKKMWWKTWKGRGVEGGLGKTDDPLRVCVYPSYNAFDKEDEPAILLCSYTWGQDSERISAFVNDDSPKGEDKLKELMLHDLARLHSKDEAEYVELHALLYELYDTHHAYDWSSNAYSSGAFALFAPGHFQMLYGTLTQPACDSRLHIVGEAVSAHHAWIVGALESAMRGVWNFLERFRLDELQKEMTKEFGPSFEIDYERAYLSVAMNMEGAAKKTKQAMQAKLA